MKATFAKFSPVFGIISLLNFSHSVGFIGAFLGGSDGKESTCNAGDLDSITGSGRSMEKGIATHFSMLAWRIS